MYNKTPQSLVTQNNSYLLSFHSCSSVVWADVSWVFSMVGAGLGWVWLILTQRPQSAGSGPLLVSLWGMCHPPVDSPGLIRLEVNESQDKHGGKPYCPSTLPYYLSPGGWELPKDVDPGRQRCDNLWPFLWYNLHWGCCGGENLSFAWKVHSTVPGWLVSIPINANPSSYFVS